MSTSCGCARSAPNTASPLSKTSTGYGFVKQASGDYNYQGATDAHLRLMRQHCGAGVQIKAAGGRAHAG